jgi:IS5 family transposase
VDSTLLKANASLSSRISRKLWEQLEEGLEGEVGEGSQEPREPGGPQSQQESASEGCDRTPAPVEDTQAEELPSGPTGKHNARRVSRTDPDAATTCRRGQGVLLGYRDHSLVDGKYGVVTATVATAADYDDGALLETLVDHQEGYIGQQPQRVVGDSAYGTQANLEGMRGRGIRPYLKRRASKSDRRGWLARMADQCDPAVALALMRRRLHTAEGRFAEAHVRYDHRRCRWRRRWRVQIQCYLVAMVQNVGKLLRWAGGSRRPARSAAMLARLFWGFAYLDRLFRRQEGPAIDFCGSCRP